MKHGNYNQDTHRPDNAGQPHDSGLYVDLCSAIREQFGDQGATLIAQAQAHGDRRYQWLIEQINALPGGRELVEDHHNKRLYLEAWRRQEDRLRLCALYRAALAQQPPPANADHLAKKLARAEKEADKAEKRWGFGLSGQVWLPAANVTAGGADQAVTKGGEHDAV